MALAIPLALGYLLFGFLAVTELQRANKLERRVNRLRRLLKERR